MSKILGIGLIAACGLVVLAGAGCISNGSTIEQQAACAKRADEMEKQLQEGMFEGSVTITSHYNKSLDTCFVYTKISKREFTNYSLENAFDETYYGTASIGIDGESSCLLSEAYREKKPCKDFMDFQKFVDKFMEGAAQ